jgi:hypothetical protein
VQILPPSELPCDSLLCIPQLAADTSQFFFTLIDSFLRFGVNPSPSLVEKTQRPAIRAAKGGYVPVDGFLDVLK